jgi:hypothetical protein
MLPAAIPIGKVNLDVQGSINALVMTAVMAKMARVVHALIKSGIPYQGYFEVSPSGSIPLFGAVGANRTP